MSACFGRLLAIGRILLETNAPLQPTAISRLGWTPAVVNLPFLVRVALLRTTYAHRHRLNLEQLPRTATQLQSSHHDSPSYPHCQHAARVSDTCPCCSAVRGQPTAGRTAPPRPSSRRLGRAARVLPCPSPDCVHDADTDGYRRRSAGAARERPDRRVNHGHGRNLAAHPVGARESPTRKGGRRLSLTARCCPGIRRRHSDSPRTRNHARWSRRR
ncbi:hypothetical protein BCR44DRAFT_1267500 [Catenaria anguillulae PL171]|uniref:Uncharacterized protein n=1 Tax=Catenaria anguillulae PL171 TaxID=765915 RepID=A0A1Y2HWV6_9FUNG|nr:hypothetical protein BCR44DRAFT_1267500 [Catenaria anguillulae PL171]